VPPNRSARRKLGTGPFARPFSRGEGEGTSQEGNPLAGVPTCRKHMNINEERSEKAAGWLLKKTASSQPEKVSPPLQPNGSTFGQTKNKRYQPSNQRCPVLRTAPEEADGLCVADVEVPVGLRWEPCGDPAPEDPRSGTTQEGEMGDTASVTFWYLLQVCVRVQALACMCVRTRICLRVCLGVCGLYECVCGCVWACVRVNACVCVRGRGGVYVCVVRIGQTNPLLSV